MKNQLLEECHFLLIVMKILGLIPFSLSTTGHLRIRSSILPVLYMGFFHGVIIWLSINEILIIFNQIRNTYDNFDFVIFNMSSIILLSISVIQPIAYVLQMKKIFKFWDLWFTTQVIYEQLSGFKLELNQTKMISAFVWITIISTIPMASILAASGAQNYYRFVKFIIFYVTLLSSSIGQIYWILLTVSLRKISEGVLKFHNKAFAYWIISERMLKNCLELRLNLLNLLKSLQESMGVYVFLTFIILPILGLTSLYGLAACIYDVQNENNYWSSDSNISLISCLILGIWNICISLSLVENTFRLIDQVDYKFKEQMIFTSLNGKCQFMREQIVEFFETFESIEGKVTVGGFSNISRGLLLHVLSTMITYIIIILQFRDKHLQQISSTKISNGI